MARTYANRIPCWVVCVSLLALVISTVISTERPAPAADARAKRAASEKLTGRLPSYYKLVVDEQQRQKIYRIQGEYRTRIKELETRLETLKKERDERIANVLSSKQKKQVETAAAQAKEKRAAKKVLGKGPPVPKE